MKKPSFVKSDFPDCKKLSLENPLTDHVGPNPVHLIFLWTKGRKLLFNKMIFNPSTEGTDLLQGHVHPADDGIHIFYLGGFSKGDDFEVSYKIKAFTSVPLALAVICQPNLDEPIPVDPVNIGNPHSFNAGDDWEKKIKYTVI